MTFLFFIPAMLLLASCEGPAGGEVGGAPTQGPCNNCGGTTYPPGGNGGPVNPGGNGYPVWASTSANQMTQVEHPFSLYTGGIQKATTSPQDRMTHSSLIHVYHYAYTDWLLTPEFFSEAYPNGYSAVLYNNTSGGRFSEEAKQAYDEAYQRANDPQYMKMWLKSKEVFLKKQAARMGF